MNLNNLFTLDDNRRLRTFFGYPTFYTTEFNLPCTEKKCKCQPRILYNNCCDNKYVKSVDYQYL